MLEDHVHGSVRICEFCLRGLSQAYSMGDLGLARSFYCSLCGQKASSGIRLTPGPNGHFICGNCLAKHQAAFAEKRPQRVGRIELNPHMERVPALWFGIVTPEFHALFSNIRTPIQPDDVTEAKCQICGKGHSQGRKTVTITWSDKVKLQICSHCYEVIKDVVELFNPIPAIKNASCSVCGIKQNDIQSLISLPGPGGHTLCEKCLNLSVALSLGKWCKKSEANPPKSPSLVPAPSENPQKFRFYNALKQRGLVPNPFGVRSNKKVLKLQLYGKNGSIKKPCTFCGNDKTTKQCLMVAVSEPETMCICEDCINNLLEKLRTDNNHLAPIVGTRKNCSLCNSPARPNLPMAVGVFPTRHLICINCLETLKVIFKNNNLSVTTEGAGKSFPTKITRDVKALTDTTEPKPPPTTPEAPS